MLWEPDNPGTVLAERFDFADAAAAADWVSRTVEQHWGIQAGPCERITMSFNNALVWFHTPHGRRVAKWSIATHRFDRLAALAEMTAWLDRRGQPVSAPAQTLDGRHQVEVDGVSLGLQREIDGELLDVTSPDQVRAAGAVLARLHEALSSYPDGQRLTELTPPAETLDKQISDWLGSDHPRAPRKAVDVLRQRLAVAPADPLPTQLVHGDFRAANVLVTGSTVTAVLDFEEACPEHRIAELARSAVLLGTKFDDWGPVTAEVRAEFLAGYQSVCRLTPAEAAWWDTLVLWISLAMIPDGDDPTGWGDAARQALELPAVTTGAE
ncbi:hypothetical protein GCM10011492_03660 [Flexivirga endophytica]|uniref:Aminoglycoside phosphotransferase domain-containing protein n=2 Tax=Flexivirga endophytica TaxID=1849103 RepID=A0A916SWA8_9MICO|nr:hypothetical protein GCM10011492_03660 [Flexivirga endophytica]GHB38445.1 hypothetical protein GCM10008112_03950 [Flexivirga endophytica]